MTPQSVPLGAEILEQGLTYQRLRTPEGFLAIRCLRCGRISYNLNDYQARYCGNCHQFHEFLAEGS